MSVRGCQAELQHLVQHDCRSRLEAAKHVQLQVPCVRVLHPADVLEQEASDDTCAIERLAEELGLQLGGQLDPNEEQATRKQQQELQRLMDNIDQPISQGSPFTVLQVCVCDSPG